MLQVQDIGLAVGGTPLLQGVRFACAPGTVTAVMGPNGAGKTSLLKVLADEHRHYQGRVLLNGQGIGDWQVKDKARMRAVLPQHSTLDFPFTVEEVVQLGRIPHSTGARRDREIVSAALRKTDADYLAKRDYPSLSGGEKQRVQLARVLAQIWEAPEIDGEIRPRLLLLDEPSASFDLAHQQLLKTLVCDFAGEGVSVVMVVHDFNLGMAVSDQIVMLCCGQIAAMGPPDQILHTDLIRSVFGVAVDIVHHPVTGKPVVLG